MMFQGKYSLEINEAACPLLVRGHVRYRALAAATVTAAFDSHVVYGRVGKGGRASFLPAPASVQVANASKVHLDCAQGPRLGLLAKIRYLSQLKTSP